jgi:hypothetical protein
VIVSLTYAEWQEQVFHEWQPETRFKIVPKGRRVGGTKGAANACIDYSLQGEFQILWGDTILSNIDRYFERYFLPELKKNEVPYEYNKVDKKLKIGQSVIDFRSADRPENWEGFGYHYIILNEAGIILKNPYLYTNAVLPMLMDFKDSKLIAIGTPKGKYLKSGEKHPYFMLAENAMKGVNGYEYKRVTSYDSPFLTKDVVKILEEEIAAMSPKMVQQEIFGEFIDGSVNDPFASAFDEERHVFDNLDFEQGKTPFISIDFNLNPFVAVIGQYRIGKTFEIDFLREIVIENGTIDKMINELKAYERILPMCRLTGDSMGNRRDIAQRDNSSYYLLLMKGLRLAERQIVVPNNPTHENSRADFNYVLANAVVRVDSRMKHFIRDLKYVEVDNEGKIIKSDRTKQAQQADALDCGRYAINTFARQWIYRR